MKADDAIYRLTYCDVAEGGVRRYATMIEGLSRQELDLVGDNADQIYLQGRHVAEHVQDRVREARKAREAETIMPSWQSSAPPSARRTGRHR